MAATSAPATATSLPPLRMVALDLDGTLLRPDSTLSERTVRTLQELHSQGTMVCVASGRPAPTVRRFARQLNIGPLPTVCFNGACAMLLNDGGNPAADANEKGAEELGSGRGQDEVWFAQTLDMGVVSAVLAVAAELDLPVQYCLPDKSLTSPVGPNQTALVAFFDNLVGPEGHSVKAPSLTPLPPLAPPPVAAADDTNAAPEWPGLLPPPLKLIVITGSQSRADEVAVHARRTLSSDRCHVIAAEVHVEFLAPNVNKASGLAHVCGALGLSLDEVVAFGDANNDVEMLTACGMSYAMPNGRKAALAAASRKCRFDNSEDGVAVELEALMADGAFGDLGRALPETGPKASVEMPAR